MFPSWLISRRVRARGYVEKSHTLRSGTRLAYAEGPQNGPALLLLHAQSSAWRNYGTVLPALATDYHVFAIDIVGHGDSDRTPDAYDVHIQVRDVIDFIETVIGGPVLLSGHSSGGLIAAGTAATAGHLVRALLLEDPPLFSTDPERTPTTFNYVDLATPAHDCLQSDERDFAAYYMAHNAWLRYFGKAREKIAASARKRRLRHPHRPLRLWFFPPSVNETIAYMHQFDPRFADAFYTFDWQRGFDQSATLRQITSPTILIHANWRITDDGVLEGAMTDDDAARALADLPDARLERVDTGHGFHIARPRHFIRLIDEIAASADAISPQR
ncbi:alpha/beta hydrolase [Microbacterium sp.]|uniref:alpha/beta fold hydrolase n=1 Tax=Microbacterium sp. TaxID=51671 RepID=UPI0026399778|nr:alpha/beta hydrolase [Microbacterium sp.]